MGHHMFFCQIDVAPRHVCEAGQDPCEHGSQGENWGLAEITITNKLVSLDLCWSQPLVDWFLIQPLLIQPWVDQNFLVSIDPNLEWIDFIWPLLIQPWMDQNFLASIDPNLEEILQILSVKKFTLDILKKFWANFLATLSGPEFSSLYWSQSRGDFKFFCSLLIPILRRLQIF